jgi:hypothetical protein
MKSLLPSLAMLAVILLFSLWSCSAVTAHTERWDAQLEAAAEKAAQEDWDGAAEALADSYRDWSAHQTFLHIVEDHTPVDDAESMYRRAAAFAGVREPSEFQAELADLRDQLRLLAERERFSVKNIL